MHEGAYRFIEQMVSWLEPRRSVIELGSRTVAGDWPYSGPVRPLFTEADHYLGVDIAAGPNVNIVADASIWRPSAIAPFRLADTVVCCETLEHTGDADRICANAWHLLDDGGVFLVTTAAPGRAEHSGVDGGPRRDGEFYRNVDRWDLQSWLEMFTFRLICDTNPGDIYALAVK